MALGDSRLALGVAALFAGSAGILRLLLRRRRLPEEQVDEEPVLSRADTPDAPPASAPRAHLR
jgi:hypothetical protein